MTWVDRFVGCLVVALVFAQPSGDLQAHDQPEAQVQEVEETVEDADDDVADWILRLFRGVDHDATKPKSGGQGGPGHAGGSAGQGTGGSGGDGDDGGDDGGGDDGGGDDGGGDDGGGDDGGGDDGGGDRGGGDDGGGDDGGGDD
jgi:hypothetical protein